MFSVKSLAIAASVYVFGVAQAAHALPKCALAENGAADDIPCERLSPEEEARLEEYAEFEAGLAATWAKRLVQRKLEDREGLKELSEESFCKIYGEVIRGEKPRFFVADYSDGELVVLMKNVAKKRRFSFNDTLVRARNINLGVSKCMMYAALGAPILENRSVGSWGVNIQHVYRVSGGASYYVYTQNGRVSSWQD